MATAIPSPLQPNLRVTLASGDALDVREFRVTEGISRLFEVALVVVSTSPEVDFEAAIGGPARFEVNHSSSIRGDTRYWSGVCTQLEQVSVEEDGLSSYELRIAPSLWLSSQRRNYRVFQDQSELDVALAILREWGIAPRLELSPSTYPKRRFRAQYAESDLDFVSRLLEDIGVAYHFEQEGGESRLVLVDAPNRRSARAPLPFVSSPNERIGHEYVTALRTRRQVRPGRYTQSDVDYRKALDYPLSATAAQGVGIETRLERYHHNYGSFLWKALGGETPAADDRGAARTNEIAGREQVRRRLEAQRVEGRGATWRTTAYDVMPGNVVTITDHPRTEVASPQLVVGSTFTGSATGAWQHTCETRYTDVDYRPELRTPKPRTRGVESATVTGPAGEEIHTDEFGRVRVHFHWDREGLADETSSCWIPVSQPWAGSGFGAINIPRVGQEVLVDFLGADPDRPVVLGRVFTTTTPPPYELPRFKMVGGMRSESYPRAKPPAASRLGGGPPAEETRAAGLVANDVAPAPRATRPLGGGPTPARMGGGGSEAVPGGPAGMPGPMPGMFGGQQAPQAAFEESVTRVQAPGPDGEDAQRSANGLVMDDTAACESLYLQGQRDLRMVAKNNFSSGVGANRACNVLGNDFVDALGYQETRVGVDRVVEVAGCQRHTVVGDILVQGMANHLVQTQNDFVSTTVTGAHVFVAKKAIVLQITGGASTLIMTPDAILIDAPKTFINPGSVVMAAIIGGKSAEEAVADAQREDRINAAVTAAAERLYDPSTLASPSLERSLLAGQEDRGWVLDELQGQGYLDGLPDEEAFEALDRLEQVGRDLASFDPRFSN